jgi:phospholipid-transporting ATPase
VLENEKFEVRPWKSLLVGNIIKIEKDQQVPCDVLLLYSSEEKGNCFIETKNLDGETNLKEKKSSTEIQDLFSEGREREFCKLHLEYEFEKPNPYLYNFSGNLKLPGEKIVPLDNNSFILRGCVLRNTGFIYGAVTYNGHETKIMLNSVKAQPKLSNLERLMNKQIILMSILQILLCIGFAFGSSFYQWYFSQKLLYMEFDKDELFNSKNSIILSWPIYLGQWLLILNNFIPISLLVSHEMVKYGQAMLICKDEKMKSFLYGEIAPVIQSSSLTEELGQVNYIFSDKTGTLTCNIMNFKKLYTGYESYGEMYKKEAILKKVPNVDIADPKLVDHLKKKDENPYLEKTVKFLSLCHTALVEGEGDSMTYCVESFDKD